MKPGPPPKPTKLEDLHGRPGRRPANRNEPHPNEYVRRPSAPKHLGRVAKNEWNRVSKELHQIGLLTKIDRTALTAYCVTYETWLNAVEMMKKHGVLIKAQSGFPMQSPYLQIANKAQAEMRKWLVEFGMTPSSRSRVSVIPGEDKKDPLGEWLASGKKPHVVSK